jgi:PadR family transcriptional regulator
MPHMVPAKRESLITQLRRGTLEYCVLALLRDQARYGFDLVRTLAEADGLVTSEGTIYPLLGRLRRDGLVTTSWHESPSGPPRRYELTPAGHRLGLVDHRTGPVHAGGRPPARPGRDRMMTTIDDLIDRYLADLEAELRGFPANRRRELLDEVGEHIAQARATLDPPTEAGIRTVLERLGDPADIAAEARERFGIDPEPAKPGTPRLEIVTLVLLVVPFVGQLVGVVLLWVSRLWTTRDKLIGTIGAMAWVWAGLGTVMVSAGSRPVGSGPLGRSETSLLEIVVLAIPFLLPVATTIYLGIRLRAHTNALPATH